MSEWKECEASCQHCGKPMIYRPAKRNGGISISGFEPMEYRHANGDFTCTQTFDASPYDNCRQYEKWAEA